MAEFSFDVKDSKDLFEKLKADYSEFLKDKASSRMAINFAINAYHLYEWTSSELTNDQRNDLQNKRQALREDFQILRDITNGSKHKDIKYTPTLVSTTKQKGAFSGGFSRGFKISVLTVQLPDGRQLYFEDIASRVFDFWNKHFK